mmetsp:Transcript_128864/g.400966  ORF Transcript_128864/g.400966 Transcript_128864/m.400966 type:complete len:227 (+) Transcript_128864:189-869(+)
MLSLCLDRQDAVFNPRIIGSVRVVLLLVVAKPSPGVNMLPLAAVNLVAIKVVPPDLLVPLARRLHVPERTTFAALIDKLYAYLRFCIFERLAMLSEPINPRFARGALLVAELAFARVVVVLLLARRRSTTTAALGRCSLGRRSREAVCTSATEVLHESLTMFCHRVRAAFVVRFAPRPTRPLHLQILLSELEETGSPGRCWDFAVSSCSVAGVILLHSGSGSCTCQ